MTDRRPLHRAALAIALGLLLPGCSVGLMVSRIESNALFPPGAIAPARAADIPGRPMVRIVSVHGDTLRARWTGRGFEADSRHIPRYATWQSVHPEFPTIGETVTLAGYGSGSRTAAFAGFGSRSVWLMLGRRPWEFPFRSFDALERSTGTRIEATALDAAAMRGELCTRTVGRLQFPNRVPPEAARYGSGFSARIPGDEIAALTIETPVGHPVRAFAIGAAIDVLAVGFPWFMNSH